jgi:hypothetical protein|tara:strand:+ start:50 stop:544 length:495 start_codon:yes stop_codon:yes gene_type:complete
MARSNHIQKESFSGIPRRIIEHSSFKSLSYTAHTLLILLGYQYRGKNNGNLVITWSLMKGWFGSNTTMFKARDSLYEAGFIVINAYGGRSGNGTKLPHLYALTWESIDQLKSDSSWMRYTHYPAKKAPLSYWRSGVNPDVKTKKERDSQFKKDVKKIKKTITSY